MPRTWKSEKTNVGSAGLGCKARVRGHDSILGALLGAGWRRGSYRYARHHPPLPADICCLMAGGFYIDVNVAAGKPSEGHEIFQRAPDFTVANVMLWRSEEHTSELQSLMRISYAVFCLKQQNLNNTST